MNKRNNDDDVMMMMMNLFSPFIILAFKEKIMKISYKLFQ